MICKESSLILLSLLKTTQQCFNSPKHTAFAVLVLLQLFGMT